MARLPAWDDVIFSLWPEGARIKNEEWTDPDAISEGSKPFLAYSLWVVLRLSTIISNGASVPFLIGFSRLDTIRCVPPRSSRTPKFALRNM